MVLPTLRYRVISLLVVCFAGTVWAVGPETSYGPIHGFSFGHIFYWAKSRPHSITVEMDADAFPIISDFNSDFGGGGGLRRLQHSGIDIAAPEGTPVLAAADGVVTTSDYHRLGGEYISIRHGDTEVRTHYLHLQHRFVDRGEHVRRGQVIGTSGCTGESCGRYPHVHFAVYVKDARDRRYAAAISTGLDRYGWLHLNPHFFHFDGVGKITLFRKARNYTEQEGLAVRITFPLPPRSELSHYGDQLSFLEPMNKPKPDDTGYDEMAAN